jgi:arginine decarboxylase
MFVPRSLFLTRGVGRHKEHLASFELALRDAGVAEFNLVSVSSIFPPGCRIVSRTVGLRQMSPGQIVFAVIARQQTNEPNRLISSSIGVAIPNDREQYGYLSEHHAYGVKGEVAGDYAEDIAAQMLATTLGIDFDVDKSYDEKKEIWKISGKIVRTTNITQSATGHKDGLWTTTVAIAILLPE